MTHTTTIWTSTPDGELFVVTTDGSGLITSAAGALNHNEILDVLDNGFDSEPELVEWINEGGNADKFTAWGDKEIAQFRLERKDG